MLRKLLITLFVFLCLAAGYVYFTFFTAATQFAGSSKYLYIYSNQATPSALIQSLRADSIIKNSANFNRIAGQMGYLDHIKPGRYKIEKDISLYHLVKLLRSGKQAPVNFVINKIRLPQDLSRLMGKAFETDSAAVFKALQGNDSSLPQNKLYQIIPNTYSIPWNYPADKIVSKLTNDSKQWWQQKNRLDKAKALGFSTGQIYSIASIVEEETNKAEDRPLVASVYINRLNRGMPLQADPTIRFALKDFKMNRILFVHLRTPSVYNTYTNGGLPPGPICTPSPVTIDAVLDAPKTDYLFFVANPDLMGGSTFTTNLPDHNKAAKLYQDSLSAFLKRKAIKEKAKADSITKASKP